MKKPTIRVTKWLVDIPVGSRSQRVSWRRLQGKGSSRRPNREDYQKSPHEQFDAHCKAMHLADTTTG